MFAQAGEQLAPRGAGTPFPLATDAFVASISAGTRALTHHRYAAQSERFFTSDTRARSTWVGQDIVLLIPADELPRRLVTWDAQASTTNDEPVVRDRLATADHLLGFAPPPDVYLEEAFGDFE
jgi:hypothetical protein